METVKTKMNFRRYMVQTRSQYEYVYRYIAFNFTHLIKIYFYFHETFGTKQGRSQEFVKGGGGANFFR